jgi:hypothetical protein
MFDVSSIKVQLDRNGRDFILLEPLKCMVWSGHLFRMIAGATSDGLSGGKLIKCCFQDEHTFLPAVFHDGCYRGFIEESLDKGLTWQKVDISRLDADELLRENMLDMGASDEEAGCVYSGVRWFGQQAFDDDRKTLCLTQ